ncbi:MAG: glycosyltransferase family 1 protein [Deltaproteobacteria bacterium]|nr:glycosyltransferase family 1 protein [Deltaproteobacteria bacterium]
MHLGIDASNIRAGGGVTHLVELLRAAKPQVDGFDKVIIWGGSSTLNCLEDRPWLKKVHDPVLDQILPIRLYWQVFKLDRLVQKERCDALFVPGGTYTGAFRPFVTFSQNLLPFEWTEARRYGVSWMLLKMLLLYKSQSRAFVRANGVIYLTQYARNTVIKKLKQLRGKSVVIPHGVDKRFFLSPREQRAIGSYSPQHPFRILYVSPVDVYKHQWHVADAVARLNDSGFPIKLDLIGSAYAPALKHLHQVMSRLDPEGKFICRHGFSPHSEIFCQYHKADVFVFASTCETFGMVITEAMAAGLPIACSNRGPMPEVLGDAGVYFDPEKPAEIVEAIRKLIEDPILRAEKAEAAFERAKEFTWERCADETFRFLAECSL